MKGITPIVSAEAKQEMFERIAQALKGTEGISESLDEGKVVALKKQREYMRVALKKASSELRNEVRKQSRLLKKVSGLPTNDLVQFARIRFDQAAAKAAAKKIKAEKATERAERNEVRQPE